MDDNGAGHRCERCNQWVGRLEYHEFEVCTAIREAGPSLSSLSENSPDERNPRVPDQG